MTGSDTIEHLWIVGPGRLGLALGSELRKAGLVSALSYRGRSLRPPVHPVFREPGVVYLPIGELPASPPSLVLLTLADEAIEPEAAELSRMPIPPAVCMHTSGVLASDSLAPLAEVGWRTGSLHPLVSVPHPIDSAPKLRGAWFGIEGAAVAVGMGESIVRALGGHALHLSADGKGDYHTGAVLASNYVVALMAAAVGSMTRSGVSETDALAALCSLARGALDDVAVSGPVMALTGPILRGDVATIERHLARLSPDERALYSVLGRETVAIARRRGLRPATAERIIGLLEAGKS